MTGRIFEIEKYRDLPLWAQALIASRIARRAVVELPTTVKQTDYDQFIAVCDALDRCAESGSRNTEDKHLFEKQLRYPATGDSVAASQALYYAIDAGFAAESSLDFGAAEAACSNSTYKAMESAAQSPFMSSLRITIFVAADVDQLGFACKESSIGRYDGLGKNVMGRLAPVWPPDKRADAAPKRPNRPDVAPDEYR